MRLPWSQGYAARLYGLERRDSPYIDDRGSKESRWNDGWIFADAEIARANASRPKIQSELRGTAREASEGQR
jgi:hypothetical protein